MKSRTEHLSHLDGIRGLLAAIVVISHICRTVNLQNSGGIGVLIEIVFSAPIGHYAVDYFIVLSGFCLTLPFAREPIFISAKWCWHFIRKRFMRIVLPYWAAIVFSWLCIVCWIGNKTGTHWDVAIPVTSKDVMAHIILLQDFLDAVPKLNHVFWSISVEWHIYFFFPFIIFLFQRYSGDWSRICLTGAAVVISFVIFKILMPHFGTHQSMNYLGLFVMGVLGCFIAYGRAIAKFQNRWWGVGFAVCLVVGVVICFTNLQHHVAGHVFDYLIGLSAMCALIYLSKNQKSKVRLLLAGRMVSSVGAFAFSTYLIHAPLIQIAWQYLFAPFRNQPLLMFGLLSTFGLIFIYVLSYLFFRFVEQPCHLLAKRI